MHCNAFRNVVSQRWSLKKEFRMHCYAFEMYLKDGPLRRSSEQNALKHTVSHFLINCIAL